MVLCASVLFACSSGRESRYDFAPSTIMAPMPLPSLRVAIGCRDAQAVRRLAQEASPEELGFALRKAALLNHLGCGRALIECGANPSAADEEGNTPLHHARSDHMVRLLTRAGADVHAKNDDGEGVGRLDTFLADSNARRMVAALDEAHAPRDPLTAVLFLDCPDVERLLATKPPLEPSVLHYAAARGDVGIVNALLAAGSDPEQVYWGRFGNIQEWGFGALSTAVITGRFEVATLLLQSGAKPVGKGWPGSRHGGIHGGLLERAAADGPVTFVAMLLAAGLKPDGPSTDDGGGDTALAHAANHGRAETVRLLLDHGADPNRVSDGASPLMHAAVMGHQDVADMLLTAGAQATVLAMVALGRAEHVRQLAGQSKPVGERDLRCGMTPLHWAVALGHRETVAVLLAAGATVDERSGTEAKWDTGAVWRKTRNWLAIDDTGISPFGRAVELKSWEIAATLVAAGATPTAGEIEALATVPGAEATGLLRALLARGPIDAERGLSALHGVLVGTLAPLERQGRFRLLLEAGVDRHFGHDAAKAVLRDADPGSVATMAGELRRRGWISDLETACAFGWLEEARVLLQGVPENFDTWPCQLAALHGDQPQAMHLLRECVRPDAWQPHELAEHAAFRGAPRVLLDLVHRGLISLEHCGVELMGNAAMNGHVPILEVLVRLGVDANGRDDGFSPLMKAATGPHLPAIEFLLRHGADVNACDANGKTALSEALRNGPDRNSLACVRVLLAAGADPVEGDVIDSLESFASWAEPADVAEGFAQLAGECRERAAR